MFQYYYSLDHIPRDAIQWFIKVNDFTYYISAFFSNGDTFCDFWKCQQIPSYQHRPHLEGRQNNFDAIFSTESVPIPF